MNSESSARQAARAIGSELDAAALKSVVVTYRDLLRTHQERLNRLNVYPVPDGDTGTNMALTLESVVAELDGCDDTDLAQVCKAISHGSLMGARGNSGVILSQVLRGLAGALGKGETFVAGLDAAREGAYQAVMRPVEGTILTVVREAAEALNGKQWPSLGEALGKGETFVAGLDAAREGAYQAVMRPVEGTILTVVREAAEALNGKQWPSLGEALDAARAAAHDALERTPELLPALKQAGVVDAGGAGFCLLIDAFLHVVAGRDLPEPPAVTDGPSPALSPEVEAAHHDAVSDLRYEVMFFLEAPDETVPRFKDVWANIGDSIVVVGGDGIWNCHIHTDDIGAAIEAAIDCGRPKKIRVTDLMEQVEEERWVREAVVVEDEPVGDPVACAVVAVATGDGIRRIFRSLGVQKLVAGGQSMNPSTAQILEAVEAVPADHVVVLPNNKNIIPVAEQVAPLTDKTIAVLKTTTVAEGFAALLEYDPDATAEENADGMGSAAARILTGEITRAVRDSTAPDGSPISEGDHLGLTRDGIKVVATDIADAAVGLLDVLVGDDHEIVTVIEGEGASAGVTRRITEWLGEHRPDVETEVHHGGQPLYPYFFSVE